MDLSIDFESFYPHHDLLVEMGQIELALDRLNEGGEVMSAALPPAELTSRMASLREALAHLPT